MNPHEAKNARAQLPARWNRNIATRAPTATSGKTSRQGWSNSFVNISLRTSAVGQIITTNATAAPQQVVELVAQLEAEAAADEQPEHDDEPEVEAAEGA